MTNQEDKKRIELLAKQELLDKANAQLKKEFIGLDPVIDKITEAISCWFLFPDIQEKPTVVNLWGLTGVGKSSLITRLSELIDFQKRFFHFDLGNVKGNSIMQRIEDVLDEDKDLPLILAFDEFQHARTLDERGIEEKESDTRLVWQLLDNGTFQVQQRGYGIIEVFELRRKIESCLFKGIRVKDGQVIDGKKAFKKMFYHDSANHVKPSNIKSDPEEGLEFFDRGEVGALFNYTDTGDQTEFDFAESLKPLNLEQYLEITKTACANGLAPKVVDCSKSIIFVLGNLDEAYQIAGNLSPDQSADDFHKISLKVNVSTVKTALRRRFRNEQIARLGNQHIIYPAFKTAHFERIIALALKKLAKRYTESHGFEFSFARSVHKTIYREGVFPTQGTRPVYTTIEEIIKSKIGRIVTENFKKKLNAEQIRFRVEKNILHVSFCQNGDVLHTLKFKLDLRLKKLRKPGRDDKQAITAVHESGHTILSCVLMKVLPSIARSTSAEANTNGFVSLNPPWNYDSKNQILPTLAVYLGGIAAERLVFGEKHVTSASSHDLQEATEYITDLLKSRGMSEVPAVYQVVDSMCQNEIHDVDHKINREAEEYLKRAFELALNTLEEQKLLLLKMAEYLSDEEKLEKDEIRGFVSLYAKNFEVSELIEDASHLYYRERLKDMLKDCDQKPEFSLCSELTDMDTKQLNSSSDE